MFYLFHMIKVFALCFWISEVATFGNNSLLVSLQVSHVLASLQAGNRGTQACITAASAVSGIIADLDTTIMFATAGTLNRENAETFADHR